ncbi:MAG: hypothetical protein L3J88_08625 [Gammaproteobacteria bacterium]|nr:hypothetical protein [Gammaproteobacteria bacterium]MCF6363392.1 hypothetical protein [Gammaproteobacteria bacterium]
MKGIIKTHPIVKYVFLFFVLSVIFPADSWAISISANVSIDTVLNPIKIGPKLGKADYGPFHVVDNGGTTNTGVGDGIDETWSWYFDFRNDDNYKKFMDKGELTDPVTGAPLLSSAVLTLTLTSKDGLGYTDGFSLGNLPLFGGCGGCDPYDKKIFYLAKDKETTLEINLFGNNILGDDIYTAEEIIGIFPITGQYEGRVLATYADDAIINSATLRLTRLTVVSEPPILTLMILALLAMIGFKRKPRTTGSSLAMQH